jgi:hypothetical protein
MLELLRSGNDNIIIDLKNPTEQAKPYVEIILKRLKNLAIKCNNQIHLTLTNAHYQEVPEVNKQKQETGHVIREYCQAYEVEPIASVIEGGSQQDWRYYNRKTHDGKYVIGKGERRIAFKSEGRRFDFNSPNCDKDLLYFLVYLSPDCEKVPVLNGHQNPQVKQAHYKVEMPEIEAKNFIEVEETVSNVKAAILKMDLAELRTFAQSKSIAGTERLNEDRLKAILIRPSTMIPTKQ